MNEEQKVGFLSEIQTLLEGTVLAGNADNWDLHEDYAMLTVYLGECDDGSIDTWEWVVPYNGEDTPQKVVDEMVAGFNSTQTNIFGGTEEDGVEFDD